MRTALVGPGVLGMVFAVAMGGCVVGESPIVGEDAGGAAGLGGSGGTSGGSGGGSEPDLTGSTTFSINEVRYDLADDPSVCFHKALPLDTTGRPICKMYVAAPSRAAGGTCPCTSGSQRPASPDATAAIVDLLADEGRCDFGSEAACDDYCACELPPAEGEEEANCLNDAVLDEAGAGWCYVSPDQGIGSSALVSECLESQRRRIRFLQTGAGPDDSYFIMCGASEVVPPGAPVQPEPLGNPCVPDDERLSQFNGFQANEVSVDTNAGCVSGVCLINHFQGRVSCPYGQTSEESQLDRKCFVPGTDVAVTVPVDPQLIERRADQAAVCSCRCAGNGPGPFCACPSNMECAPVIEKLGLPTDGTLAGSYCIPRGSAYDPIEASAEICDRPSASCGDAHPY